MHTIIEIILREERQLTLRPSLGAGNFHRHHGVIFYKTPGVADARPADEHERVLKDHRPLAFFGWIAVTSWTVAVALGVPLAVTYLDTGLVPRLPTAVLVTGLVVIGLLLAGVGLVLDSLAKGRVEAKRLAYLQSRQVGS